MTGENVISVADVSVTFGDKTALDGFCLDVPAGCLLTLVGPSGCGKTTALRVIAGFEPVKRGTVSIRDTVVLSQKVNVPPEKRRVGMVFQEYALFPHLTVAENVGYGVRGPRRDQTVAESLHLVNLDGYDARFPHELSGGEQQRVALARALAPSPDVVLLDEPFSNLDAPQRERMRRELRKIIKAAGVTAVLVTHDQAEALALADVVAVMQAGRIAQVGRPDEVYRSPISRWVATFLGDAWVFTGVASHGEITTPVGSVKTDLADGNEASVMIRPEWIRPIRTDAPGHTVIDTEFRGHDQRVEIELRDGGRVDAIVSSIETIQRGDTITLEILNAAVYPAVE